MQVFLRAAAVALSLVVVAPASAVAADKPALSAETQKLVVEMIEAAGMMQMIDQMGPAIANAVTRDLQRRNSLKSLSKQAQDEISAVASEETLVAAKGLIATIVPLFGEYFTHDELRDLIAFHRSPVGQKSQKFMPVLMQRMMASSATMQQDLAARLRPKIADIIEKDRARQGG